MADRLPQKPDPTEDVSLRTEADSGIAPEDLHVHESGESEASDVEGTGCSGAHQPTCTSYPPQDNDTRAFVPSVSPNSDGVVLRSQSGGSSTSDTSEVYYDAKSELDNTTVNTPILEEEGKSTSSQMVGPGTQHTYPSTLTPEAHADYTMQCSLRQGQPHAQDNSEFVCIEERKQNNVVVMNTTEESTSMLGNLSINDPHEPNEPIEDESDSTPVKKTEIMQPSDHDQAQPLKGT